MQNNKTTLKIGLTACLLIGVLSSPAFADLREQQRQLRQQTDDCQPDARRLCHRHIPNVDAITACMQRHVQQLSPACRRHFHHGHARR